MRRFIFFIAIFTVSLQAFAQSKTEQKLIQAPLVRFFDAMSAQQPDGLKAEVTPDFSLLENGKVWNTDSLTIAIVRYKGLDLKRVNHFDFIKTEQMGNVAWLSYYNTADITFKGKQINIRWLESAVLIKEKQLWKIKFLHSTELKPTAPEKT